MIKKYIYINKKTWNKWYFTEREFKFTNNKTVEVFENTKENKIKLLMILDKINDNNKKLKIEDKILLKEWIKKEIIEIKKEIFQKKSLFEKIKHIFIK